MISNPLSPRSAQELGHVPARLGDQLGTLADALGTWATRDDSKAQPQVTSTGHAAVDAIDRMLAELHRAREQLVTEVRQHQDAELVRVDAMLAELRAAKDRDGARWPVLDSELWTCTGCGGQFIGRRPASDRCRYCQTGGAR